MAKTDNLTDFMTDLANTIRAKKQITGPINAQDFSSEIESISGGTQPTLFEPTVIEGLNSVAWSTNANNGGFAVTTVGRIDQTEVTSPLTITSDMNGKTLYITSDAELFNQSQKIITLQYEDVMTQSILTLGPGCTRNPSSTVDTDFYMSLSGAIYQSEERYGYIYVCNGQKIYSNNYAEYYNQAKMAIGGSKTFSLAIRITDKTKAIDSYLPLIQIMDYDISQASSWKPGKKIIPSKGATVKIYLNGEEVINHYQNKGASAAISFKSLELFIGGDGTIQTNSGNWSQFENGDLITFNIDVQ